MTSNRPYLIRALYEWIADNDMTPHLLVDAEKPGVVVPRGYVVDGRIVLNLATGAVQSLVLGDEAILFAARFSGKSFPVEVPVGAVLGIYARENGQGMLFPEEHADDAAASDDEQGAESSGGDTGPTDGPNDKSPKRPALRVVK
ncbi:ClpXP protease specificity-enhancing factor [Halochromatium roseum]|uniref:ClpXP protease specificity-enhancing factor n=1 Tax=Halochromatium roseum TaxID=391920 RepID=UPI001912A649|nr:ClpXP protease specificity-enhancing factor [Halochromatium roseum]MBK5938484.1 ClpXP protease specificity-enhancing factor [Halochromatium roseum]